MNSTTSLPLEKKSKFFDKTILKHNLRTYWVAPVVAIIVMMFNVLDVADRGRYYGTENNAYDAFSMNYQGALGFCFFIACVYGFVLATRLFMYLDRPNSVSFMHGMPLSRKKLYFSQILSGIVLCAIPPVFLSVVMLLFSIGGSYFTVTGTLVFLATYMLYTLLALSISSFAMIVCGNPVISTLSACAASIAPLCVVLYYNYIMSMFYGYCDDGSWSEILLKIYMFPDVLYPWRFLIYVALIAVIIAVGYLLYAKRHLENCTEVVAFPKLRGLFVMVVGFVIGIIGQMLLSLIFNEETILFMLPLGIVGIIGANMLVRKSVSLKGSIKYIIIFVLIVSAFEVIVHYDFFGYEKYIPMIDDIDYVETDGIGAPDYGDRLYTEKGTFVMDDTPENNISKKEDIEKVIALHKAYIANKDYNGTDHDMLRKVRTISYVLKDGRNIKRKYYYLSAEDARKYAMDVMDIDIVKKAVFPIANENGEKLSISFSDNRAAKDDVVFYAGSREYALLCEAFEKDVMEHSISELYSDGLICINADVYFKGHYADGTTATTTAEKYDAAHRFSVAINKNWENTLAALEKIGISVTDEKALQQIKEVRIGVYNYRYNAIALRETVEIVDPDSYSYEYSKVTDKDEIRKLYEYAGLSPREDGEDSYYSANDSNVVLLFIDEYGNITFSFTKEIRAEDIPDILSDYITVKEKN